MDRNSAKKSIKITNHEKFVKAYLQYNLPSIWRKKIKILILWIGYYLYKSFHSKLVWTPCTLSKPPYFMMVEWTIRCHSFYEVAAPALSKLLCFCILRILLLYFSNLLFCVRCRTTLYSFVCGWCVALLHEFGRGCIWRLP